MPVYGGKGNCVLQTHLFLLGLLYSTRKTNLRYWAPL